MLVVVLDTQRVFEWIVVSYFPSLVINNFYSKIFFFVAVIIIDSSYQLAVSLITHL